MPDSQPTSVTLRAYQVGFGDCFLLSFHYAGRRRTRHVLIDFGTTSLPKGAWTQVYARHRPGYRRGL